jgi:hypothetical protein
VSNTSDIIQINISRETAAVSRVSFNIPLFLAAHTAFSSRTAVYEDITEVADDFTSSSNVYKAALRLFSQENKPPKIIVGRRQVDSVNGSIGTVAANTVYSLTINNTVISATSDSTPTAIEIVAALRSQFAAASVVGINMTDNLNGTFSVSVSSPGASWSIKSSSNVALTLASSTESWADSIAAVESENNDWYALTAETHNDADILVIAEAIEARKKIYGTSSSSSAILTTATTDIASQLKAAGYQRTFISYSASADTQFPECAWIGYQLPETPGSNTWKFKSLSSVTRDTLSSTQSNNANNKNCNTYETIGGLSIMREGKMSGGEFIDVMIFADWLEARMVERIYSRLVNTKKIPLTQAGLTLIQSEMYAVLQEGITNGGLANNPKPKVFVPSVASISPNVKALRTVEDITFEGTLAGAIHFVRIAGTISV